MRRRGLLVNARLTVTLQAKASRKLGFSPLDTILAYSWPLFQGDVIRQNLRGRWLACQGRPFRAYASRGYQLLERHSLIILSKQGSQ